MISTVSKAVITGLTCGTLGLGVGGVWATNLGAHANEPMRTLVKPLAVVLPGASEEAAFAEAVSVSDPHKVGAAAGSEPAQSSLNQSDGQAGTLEVKRLVVTNRLVGREPAPNSDLKADGSEVIAFVELSNQASQAHRIEIVFEHESGQKVGFVKLPVPEDRARWRTWAKTRQIKKGGRWVATVRDETGADLMSQAFTVETS